MPTREQTTCRCFLAKTMHWHSLAARQAPGGVGGGLLGAADLWRERGERRGRREGGVRGGKPSRATDGETQSPCRARHHSGCIRTQRPWRFGAAGIHLRAAAGVRCWAPTLTRARPGPARRSSRGGRRCVGGTMAQTGSVCPGAEQRGAEEAPPWRRAARSRLVSSLWSISTLDACEAVTALLTISSIVCCTKQRVLQIKATRQGRQRPDLQTMGQGRSWPDQNEIPPLPRGNAPTVNGGFLS